MSKSNPVYCFWFPFPTTSLLTFPRLGKITHKAKSENLRHFIQFRQPVGISIPFAL